MRSDLITKYAVATLLILSCGCLAQSNFVRWNFEQWQLQESFGEIDGFFAGHNGQVAIITGGITPEGDFSNRTYIHESQTGNDYVIEDGIENAFGACVSIDEGVVCVGGLTNGNGFSKQIILLDWDSDTNKLNKKKLTSLPVEFSKLSTAVIDDKLYVAGEYLWVIGLKEALAQSGRWRRIGVLAGYEGCLSLSASAQSNGQDKELYLFFSHDNEVQIVAYDPDTDHIKTLSSFDIKTDKIFTLPCGQSHILLATKTENKIYSYHTITDAWSQVLFLPEDYKLQSVLKGDQKVVSFIGLDDNKDEAFINGNINILKGNFGLLDYLAIVIYLGGVIGIGWYFSRREQGINDFFLGGKRIPGWAAGLSLLATQVSSIGFMAIPAKSYATNWLYEAVHLTV
jgi:solute:Na+ symporter, SSS family